MYSPGILRVRWKIMQLFSRHTVRKMLCDKSHCSRLINAEDIVNWNMGHF